MSAIPTVPGPELIKEVFNPTTLERAGQYLREGRIMTLDVDAARGLVSGRVRGSGRRIYYTIVSFGRGRGGRIQVSGQCSCPVGFNCKHAAALLLAAGGGPSQAAEAAARLPPEIERWLERCAELAGRAAMSDPHRLFYVLRPEVRYGLQRLLVGAFKVRQLQAGGWGKPQVFKVGGESRAAFVTAEDRRIMALVRARPMGGLGSEEILSEETGADVLRAIAGTGYGHWLDLAGPALREAAPVRARLQWRLGDDTRQRVVLECDRPGLILLPLTPPWYLDPESGECGPLETGLDGEAAGLLAMAPAVAPDAATALEQVAERRLKGLAMPLPPRPTLRHLEGRPPTPRLRLYSDHLPAPAGLRYWGAPAEPEWVHYAVLDFLYGQDPVDPRHLSSTHQQVIAGELVERQRDQAVERDSIQLLENLGFDPTVEKADRGGPWLELPGDSEWISFMRHEAPGLQSQGWRIEPMAGFQFQLAETGDWQLDLAEREGGGWMDLALGVEVDGARMDLLPVLLELIRSAPADISPQALTAVPEGAELPVRLADGRILLMPAARLGPILSTLIELYDPEQRLEGGRRLRLPRIQAAQLAELEDRDPGLRWQGGEALLDWGRRLRDFQGIAEIEPPAGLQAELRPYQRKGLDWLQFLRDYGLGGILADDMGLGKTVQALAHLLVEKAAGRADRPSLVIAPTSLMFNWRREAARFAPELKVLLLHGAARRKGFDAIPEHDLVLTTYPLLPRDLDVLGAAEYHLLILDEAQAIKNPRSKAAQAVRTIRTRHRLCLTGTPLENHLGELWALLDFLMPDILGDERRFRRLFRTPIERQGDAERQDALRRRVAPFLLRRTKEAVAAELPPKTEILREVPLAADQRDLYETLRLALHERVRAEVKRKGLAQSGIIILDALLKLRQVCCDPRLVALESARRVKGSAKLELLLTLLPELLEEGRRILLFSQFTSMLALIEEALAQQGIREGKGYVKLTGQTRRRDEPVDRFQSGEVPLFLISLKAGGSGLNLTAADTVIHYDPWWNPAAERQATDRAHRIGQDKPVFVYKLLTEGTVEQRVAELQARKQALADAMLAGGGTAAGALSPEDLELLFAPVDV